MKNQNEEFLIEEILFHCREIARLDQEYARANGLQGAPTELQGTARAVRRVLRQREAGLQSIRRQPETLEQAFPSPAPSQEPPAPSESTAEAEPNTSTPEAARITEPPARPEEGYLPAQQPDGKVIYTESAAPEVRKASAPKTERPRDTRREETLEATFGTAWLLRIGGVLLMIGIAYGAAKLQALLSPELRLAAGSLVAGILTGVGFLVQKRHTMAGRTTTIIGLAIAYFLAFGSHYLPYIRIFATTAIPALLMMTALAGTIVMLAERWRSEFLASFGVALVMLAALISARGDGGTFALVALGMISLASGFLLVRNEWAKLTAFSAVSTYGSLLILWILLGKTTLADGVAAHLGALVLYHAVYTVAFLRWSRRSLAIEKAAVDAPRTHATPRISLDPMPYDSGFAILNSLSLIGLSILLLWWTKTYWDQLEWWLFTLAALEGGRLLFGRIRHSHLASFHVISSTGLITGGIICLFSGATESAVLALQTLILAVAGSRSPRLRWLGILSAIPGFLAVRGYLPPSVATAGDYAVAMLTPALLLASAVSWRMFFRIDTDAKKETGFLILDGIAGVSRSLVAAFMIIVCTAIYFDDRMQIPLLLAGGALLLGVWGARATNWLLPSVVLVSMGLLAGILLDPMSPMIAGTFASILIAIVALWEHVISRAYRLHIKILNAVVAPAGMVGIWLVTAANLPDMGLLNWVILAVIAGSLYVIYRLIAHSSPQAAPPSTPASAFSRHFRLSLLSTVVFALWTVYTVITVNATQEIVSPLILSGIFLAGWQWFSGRGSMANAWREGAFLGLGLFVYTAGLIQFIDQTQLALLLAALGGGACLIVGRLRSDNISLIISVTQILALTVLSFGIVVDSPLDTSFTAAVAGILIGLVAAAGSWVMFQKAGHLRRDGERSELISNMSIALIVGCATQEMAILSAKALFSGMFTTLSWGVLASLLLAGGFLLRVRSWRYTAIGVFALSIGRVILYDLSGSDTTTKVIAFSGLGLLLIAAGILYGVASRHLLGGGPPSDTRKSDVS